MSYSSCFLNHTIYLSYTLSSLSLYQHRSDEACRNAYRQLAALHEVSEITSKELHTHTHTHQHCEGLLTLAEETGRITRETRQLEDQVDVEKKKEMSAKLADIQKDFDAIKGENTGLEAQIKQLKAAAAQ